MDVGYLACLGYPSRLWREVFENISGSVFVLEPRNAPLVHNYSSLFDAKVRSF